MREGADRAFPGGAAVPHKLCFELPGHFSSAAPECALRSTVHGWWVAVGGHDPAVLVTPVRPAQDQHLLEAAKGL